MPAPLFFLPVPGAGSACGRKVWAGRISVFAAVGCDLRSVRGGREGEQAGPVPPVGQLEASRSAGERGKPRPAAPPSRRRRAAAPPSPPPNFGVGCTEMGTMEIKGSRLGAGCVAASVLGAGWGKQEGLAGFEVGAMLGWAGGVRGCCGVGGSVPQDLSTPALHEHCTEERVPVPKSSQREGGNKGGELLGPAVVTSCAGTAGPT